MIFNSFAGAAGVVLVAALSPGPNNVVVLRAAAAGDGSRAWSAIGGVVCGGIAMLAGTIAAGSAVLTTPHFRLGVAIAGATYLAWLGLTMMRGSASPGKDSPLPAGFYGVFVFQFLNPKSWVMVLSLVAAFPPMGGAMTFAWLAPIFVVIPTACSDAPLKETDDLGEVAELNDAALWKGKDTLRGIRALPSKPNTGAQRSTGPNPPAQPFQVNVSRDAVANRAVELSLRVAWVTGFVQTADLHPGPSGILTPFKDTRMWIAGFQPDGNRDR